MDRSLGLSIAVALVGVAVILALVVLNGPAVAEVTFQETGLPAGRPWFVTIDNVTHASSLENISVPLLPGTYAFVVSLANTTDYLAYPGSGSLRVTSAGATMKIAFVRSTGNLTVRETGLPAGTDWTVAEGSVYHDSDASALRFRAANGAHDFRVLVASNVSIDPVLPGWIDLSLYLANLTRFAVAVNGTDVAVDVAFTPLFHLNTTEFPVPVFANKTALGDPAYEYLALTPARYTTANLTFNAPVIDNVSQNATGYLMSAAQFGTFARTGNASAYLVTTGNVSMATLSVNLASGTWYFMVTGWGVDAFRAVGLGYYITFPESDAIFT